MTPLAQLLPPLAQVAQAVAVLVLAVLLWPVVRVIRSRPLDYWARGWVLLAGSLAALFLSFRLPAFAPPLRAVYVLGGCGWAFLLWAGSRAYATGRPLALLDFLWLAGPILFGLFGPILLPNIAHLFGGYAAVLTAFFAAALWHARRFRLKGKGAVGGRVFQLALLALALLFAHYTVLVVVSVRPAYIAFSSLLDAAAELSLGFGMVSLASARLRGELEIKNRQLAAVVGELEKAARTDALTGLLNRRGLDDLLVQPDRVHPGAVAVIDMNNLKPLNDRYGHHVGDVALQLVARALRNLFRVTDPIVRSGGDEFLVLMPGGTVGELTRRMEELDAALLNQRVPEVDKPVNVRVAWGIAAYTGPTLPAALQAADDAMYAQKRVRKDPSGG